MTGIDPAMFDLFREETRAHADTLSRGLLDLEADPTDPRQVEPLMRAAHSLKGAARIVGIDPAVRLAHAMEDALVAAQAGRVRLTPVDIDALLKGADVLAGLSILEPTSIGEWAARNEPAVAALQPTLQAIAGGTRPAASPAPVPQPEPAPNDLPAPPPHEPVTLPAEPLPLTGKHSKLDLFREEARANLFVVATGLRAQPPAVSDAMLEALRQLRGAARVMKCPPVESAAAAMTDYLAATRERHMAPEGHALDWLRFAVDTLAGLVTSDEATFPAWVESAAGPLLQAADVLGRAAGALPRPAAAPPQPTEPVPPPPVEPAAVPAKPDGEAVVRVTARSLNRLMGLAGESLVQARWLAPFSAGLLRLRKQHDRLSSLLDEVRLDAADDRLARQLGEARAQVAACRAELADRAAGFDDHAARAEDLNGRLYREVIVSRMRPFADGTLGLARLVRDMARSLGKEARLVIEGEQTEVDRDVLDRLEAPLSHLIRNAVDHGVEPPEDRERAGKPRAGTVRLSAAHRAGMLVVTAADDGRGVNLDKLRRKVVDRGLSSAELVGRMTDTELLEFLFLPGFSTAPAVTEFSGRGVGLDVVQDAARKIGGSVRVATVPGTGTTFTLHLPITLSVIRAVIVQIGGEPYAFPHTRIDRLLRVPRAEVRSLEHRQFAVVDGMTVGLVLAGQVLDVPAEPPAGDSLPVILLTDATGAYGLVVDRFVGEQDLVVRPLDPRLGKVPDVAAAAVLDDGNPVLVVDVEHLVRSMDHFIQTGALRRCEAPAGPSRRKRVLVVDDSITVREVEQQLLRHAGYDVEVAVDGMDGWAAARAGGFDLVVTDVDMPRMTGLQLVQAVRADARVRDLPVVIVSYKEREEDRRRGLEVGANAYLTKSSFHDNRFVRTVEDLIGPAQEV
jgi:two-component system sensor histidine kinase and response regulator WspE